MSTTVHLVRHGHHALIGDRLCGRMCGVALDDQGVEQMGRVARFLSGQVVTGLQSSPQLRARQSANIIAEALSLAVEQTAAADELDFGEWTGRSFDSLDEDPSWMRWNEQRASSVPPWGESMHELQMRFTTHIEQLEEAASNASIVIVSHAEPIRAVLLACLGVSLDRYAEIEIDLASISTIECDGARMRVKRINERGIS